MMSEYSASDMMTIAAARRLSGSAVCFVGIGLPSAAANLARLCHAPGLNLIYEAGTIGAKPTVLPLSIGDGELATSADTVVSTAELFRYWLQGGRIDVGFLGAAQIDAYGNLNSTVIGTYEKPAIRLPGAGGAPEIAAHSREVLIVMRQSTRTFVEKLPFVTSPGFLRGDAREWGAMRNRGPTAVVTDLCILEPDPLTRELTVTAIHPDCDPERIRAATGWPIRFSETVVTTPVPLPNELAALRMLQRRTREAHGE